eukprot:m.904362 g.904362  ORF g.904362 m.904362 type:complete len:90 (-) comp23695_c0_seq20:917-1186(-)
MLSMAWLWSTACYDKFSDTSREHSDRQSLSTTKCPTAPATTDAEVCVLVHPKQEICDGAVEGRNVSIRVLCVVVQYTRLPPQAARFVGP